MTFAIFDTSTDKLSCALFVHKKLVEYKYWQAEPGNYSGTSQIVSVMASLCAQANIQPKNFDFIATGVGPGSFTGIRLSLAFAKGMAVGLSIPLIGVSSLHGFVPETKEDYSFVSAIDGRSGGVFVVTGECRNGQVRFASQESLVDTACFESLVQEADYLITPSLLPLAKRLDISALPQTEKWFGTCHAREQWPNIEFLGCRALEIFEKGEFSEVKPVYLRATQAEINKE